MWERRFEVLPGTDVPSATKAMAVTESLSPTEQPKALATSPMTAVSTPIQMMEMVKQSQPPIRSAVWLFVLFLFFFGIGIGFKICVCNQRECAKIS